MTQAPPDSGGVSFDTCKSSDAKRGDKSSFRTTILMLLWGQTMSNLRRRPSGPRVPVRPTEGSDEPGPEFNVTRISMPASNDPDFDQAITTGNVEFALNAYAGLRGRAGNLFFSPYSIMSALAMTYAGADRKSVV